MNLFLAELIKQGAWLPPNFDWYILDTPMKGNLTNQSLLNSIFHMPRTTFKPASTSNHPVSQLPISSAPLHNSTNYVNASFPPISVISLHSLQFLLKPPSPPINMLVVVYRLCLHISQGLTQDNIYLMIIINYLTLWGKFKTWKISLKTSRTKMIRNHTPLRKFVHVLMTPPFWWLHNPRFWNS